MANIIQKKRLAKEVQIIKEEPLYYCTAYPDESNPLIWYFLIKGQKGTDYHTGTKNANGKYEGGEGGEYIGKIVHSTKYPIEPPDYYMLTPSGRYDIGKKICLTNSSYHRGEWSSTWNIISILISFYSIWLDDKEHGISHITDSVANRKKMASESIAYNLKNNHDIYKKFDRTHLTDEAPDVPKKKIMANESMQSLEPPNESTKHAEQILMSELTTPTPTTTPTTTPTLVQTVSNAFTSVMTQVLTSTATLTEALPLQKNLIKENDNDKIKIVKGKKVKANKAKKT